MNSGRPGQGKQTDIWSQNQVNTLQASKVYGIGAFPRWNRNSVDSGNLGITATLVVSWFLRQEVACSNFFTLMTNIFVTEFSENIHGKLKYLSWRLVCQDREVMTPKILAFEPKIGVIT